MGQLTIKVTNLEKMPCSPFGNQGESKLLPSQSGSRRLLEASVSGKIQFSSAAFNGRSAFFWRTFNVAVCISFDFTSADVLLACMKFLYFLLNRMFLMFSMCGGTVNAILIQQPVHS